MSNANKQFSKRERIRKLATRIVCGFLALLMVGSVAYYTIIALAS